ncbi:hypothetical protein [Blastomonas sp. AAP53]|uniref:hypothetical protein n=1 Tax=Blastomonas sp. AAP53 TaxID=1248760 RepID=UPI0002E18821|nr:hypothetical protein [Blastomonas sp. AAP53]
MRTALAVLALATFINVPAHAEVTAQSDTGFAVQHSVTVSTDPEATFAMLRTPAKWWDKDHTWTGSAENLYMDAQAGGCFCELIPNEATTESGAPQRTLRGSVQHMQIVYVDPGNRLRLSGALGPLQAEAVTGTMTISLKPIKGGTRLTFEYVVGGYMRIPMSEAAPNVDAVIGAQASRLAMALGPLVGAGDAPAEPADTPDTASNEGLDAAAAAPADSTSVADLVTDLAPDEAVSVGAASDADDPDVAEPAAAKPKPAKPAARPATRPAPEKESTDNGR